MIVYTGKNFWNDFNNGDEGLFQDANWPRDDDKFKLRPWLQSDRWDWRWSNKNISTVASQLYATWTTTNVAASYNMPDGCTISKLSEMGREGNPWCIVNKDWNVEITENGTYIIQASTQFLPPSAPSSWFYYVEEVCLLSHKTWNYTWFERAIRTLNQVRMCGSGDEVMALWVWWHRKWEVLNVWAIHNYTQSMELFQRMNIWRLA
jgi:hypothetical protein